MKGHSISTWECSLHIGKTSTTKATYEAIAYHGVPVCPECGEDMEFQKEVWIENQKGGIKK